MPVVGELVFAGLLPHPPIVVPEVGGGELERARQTVAGMREFSARLATARPEVVVLISPHGPVFSDAVAITAVDRLTGSLADFRAPGVRFDYPNDLEMVELITRRCLARRIAVASVDRDLCREYGVTASLDHGAMVPLYYLRQVGWQGRLVAVAMGFLPLEELYSFGVALQEAIRDGGKRVAVVASGDLSHRLTPDAPSGYDPRGKEFDQQIREMVERLDVPGLVSLPSDLVERAGQCGLRPLLMMLGALDGLEVDTQVLSYEGPFGVGYMVAAITPKGENPGRRMEKQLFGQRKVRLRQVREVESAPVRLARASLEAYVREGREIPVPEEVPPDLAVPAGAFVSLKKHGELRGCIGTVGPTHPSVAAEIIHNAIQAGTEDPRFNPVRPEELDELVYSVDILQPSEPIKGLEDLDPKRYGVIVRSGRRSGLLLPDLEGVDTAEEQVAIAKRKAGIGPHEKCQMERFEVIRYK
ncbi:hypothetical protein SY88_15255 [Clostridiales bacterium PH28_bin88]|nr:hypothetical protein SY88_15255 [Clostridiales bacterium PH28_bin88]